LNNRERERDVGVDATKLFERHEKRLKPKEKIFQNRIYKKKVRD
jgi:hypothetical protein